MKWSIFGPDLGKINLNDDNNFYEDDLEINHEKKKSQGSRQIYLFPISFRKLLLLWSSLK